jgi:hypothetical protein
MELRPSFIEVQSNDVWQRWSALTQLPPWYDAGRGPLGWCSERFY